ncbi:HAD family hydrolase [Ureibacillus sp. Re31]|uniref:HAD family hydrolase n=1 Tax=Ureibacillus galli TaxID=2762222 RepID=A0ABR8XAJ8_9BACL|nr:HAD family hydrolase [Ureibacillus galli]MBD8026344.1 HAD family hydrolase [Ureibacillus galli]
MIKAVLFDLDGTLLNRDESVRRFVEDQYERLCTSFHLVRKEEYVKRFLELDNRGYVWKDNVYKQLTMEMGITKITWQELYEDYITEFYRYCVPFPHLKMVLEELRRNNLLLGIVTNGRGHFQMANIKALEIEEYFQTIVISEWEGIKKPHPKIFKRAMEKLNVSPSQCVFVGDHPRNDIEASQKIGMKTIWKKDCATYNVNTDNTIDDLAEIPFIISKFK